MGTNFRLIGIFGVLDKPTTSPDRCPANERDRSDSTVLFLTPFFPPGVFRPSLLLGFLLAFFLAVMKQVHHS